MRIRGVFAVLLGLVLLFALSTPAHAASTSGISYHGRILKADGTPLEGSSVQFKLQIRSPGAESCLLYEEVQTINMANSAGVFAISLNDGTGVRDDNSGILFGNVFSNRSTLSFPAGTCASGSTYLPNTSDNRSFVVSFKDESMQAFETLPAQPVNFAPTAIQALQIAGFGPNNLFRVDDATAVANTTPLNNTQYNALMAVANGTAPYVSSSATGGAILPTLASAPTTPVSGAIWYNSGTNSLQFYNGSTTQSLGTSSASGTVTSVGTGTGLTGGPITTAGTISLATFGTAGTYYKVVTDSTGRVSSGATALVASDIPTLTTAGSVSGSAITSGTIAGSAAMNSTGAIMTTGNIAGTNVSAASLSGNSILLYNSGNTHKITLAAPALTADYNLVFPMTAGASGNVLSTDGAGNLSWVAPASASLSSGQTGILPIANGGTGTATGSITGSGALTFAAGGTNQNVTLNPSGAGYTLLGGNVGIGTASPGQTLHVQGNIVVPYDAGGAGNGQIGIGNSAGTSLLNYIKQYSNVTTLMNAENGSLVFGTNGSEKMRISSTGNVGVGTSSPSVSLDIGAKTDALRLPNGTTAQEPTTALAGMIRYNTSTPGIEFYNGAAWTTLSTSGASSFSGVTNISDSTGNITLAPQSSTGAVVVNSGTVSTSSSTGAVQVTGGEGVSGAIYAGTSMNAGSSVTAATSMISPQIYGSTAASGNLKLDGTSNATAGNVLLARAGGNVGIGTTSPAGALDVNGSISIKGLNGISFPPDYTANSSLAVGPGALAYQPVGTSYTQGNTAVGSSALSNASMTNAALKNTALGYQAGLNTKTGSGNVFVGYQAMASSVGNESNITAIGSGVTVNVGAGGSNTTVIGANATCCGAGTGGTVIGAYATGANNGGISINGTQAGNASIAIGGTTSSTNAISIGTSAKNGGAGGISFGAGTGNSSLSGSANVLLGPGVGSSTLSTGANNILIGTSNSVDTPSATTSNFLNIANVIYATSIGTAGTGNVGIGTTSPSVSLDLGTKTDALRLPNGTTAQEPATALAGMIRYNTSTPGIEFYNGTAWTTLSTSGASSFSGVTNISDSTGNIALSPQSSTGAVVVNSGTPSTSSTTGAMQITGGEGVSGAIYAGTSINAGSSVTAATLMISPQIYGSTAASGNLKLDGTSNATVGNVLLASVGGNVGVGTANPSTILHVYKGGTNAGMITVEGDGGSGQRTGLRVRPYSGLNNQSYAGFIGIDNGASSARAAIMVPNSATAPTDVFEAFSVLPGSGNVGIGTSAPAGMLDVEGGTAATTVSGTNLKLVAQSGGAVSSGTNTNGGNILLMPGAVGTGGSGGFAGGVGIGTTSPQAGYALTVNGNLDVTGYTQSARAITTGGTVNYPDYAFFNSNSAGMFSPATNTIGFSTASTKRMRIDASGNVGIGTTSPAAALDVVAGSIRPGAATLGAACSPLGSTAYNSATGAPMYCSSSSVWTLTYSASSCSTTTASGTGGSVNANCSGSLHVTGGGCGNNGGVLNASLPSGNGWACTWSSAASGTAYAICCP